MQVSKFTGDHDAIEFVATMDYDQAILEWDTPIVVRVDGDVVAVGNYAAGRVEIVTDSQDAADAICQHFASESIKEIDCLNDAIRAELERMLDHPFAGQSENVSR